MRKLLAVLLLSSFALAAPPTAARLSTYRPHAEALAMMFPDTHTRGGGGAANPFASGGTTNNVIPKSNGSSQLADSALTDNATQVISTEPIRVPLGAVGADAVQFNAAGVGFYSQGSNNVTFDAGGARFYFSNTGITTAGGMGNAFNGSSGVGVAGDVFLGRRGAANWGMGAGDVNGTPVDQTLSFQNAITGSDLPGGHFTIDAPLGTGLGAASKVSINRAIMKATGATAQTSANALAIGMSKTLSNTSATAQTIATITLGSNAGGGASGIFTLVCTDGTNFDSETQSFNVSFVNKAGAVTVGTPAITTSTAANNSGSCTLGITAVASSNDIAIKVTPVFGTIVPTTVTLYPIITHSTNTVTFN